MAHTPLYCLLTLGIVLFALQMGTIVAQDGAGQDGKAANPQGAPDAKADDKPSDASNTGEAGKPGDTPAAATTAAAAEVKQSEAPHVASLRWKDDKTKPFCGGSLIKPNVVVTAAQCCDVRDFAKSAIVVVGSVTRADSANNYEIRKVVLHSSFSPSSADNDIALVFLKKSVPAKTAKPIALNRSALRDGVSCKVYGWSLSKATQSDTLKALDVTIAPQTTCTADADIKKLFKTNQLCIKTGEACVGDAGGSMVCGKSLGGIVSYGQKCDVEEKLEVYTAINGYTSWIDKEIKKGGAKKKSGSNYVRPSMASVVLAIGLSLWQAIQKFNIPLI